MDLLANYDSESNDSDSESDSDKSKSDTKATNSAHAASANMKSKPKSKASLLPSVNDVFATADEKSFLGVAKPDEFIVEPVNKKAKHQAPPQVAVSTKNTVDTTAQAPPKTSQVSFTQWKCLITFIKL
jgi:hypothetical protein